MSRHPKWRPDGWGDRARIGLLTPHSDFVPEGEFHALAPRGVSVHVARVPLGWRSGPEPPPIGLDAVRAFAEPPDVDRAVELLASAPVKAIAYGFTSSGYVLGPDGDNALRRRLEDRAGGIPVVLPCQAAVLALQALGAKSLALINPPWFPDELSDMGAAYFRKLGVGVPFAASATNLARNQLSVTMEDVYDWVCEHVPDTAESVFIGGGGLRAVGVVAALEQTLGRPVLTTNQVAFWQALRLADVHDGVEGYGQIFTSHLPA